MNSPFEEIWPTIQLSPTPWSPCIVEPLKDSCRRISLGNGAANAVQDTPPTSPFLPAEDSFPLSRGIQHSFDALSTKKSTTRMTMASENLFNTCFADNDETEIKHDSITKPLIALGDDACWTLLREFETVSQPQHTFTDILHPILDDVPLATAEGLLGDDDDVSNLTLPDILDLDDLLQLTSKHDNDNGLRFGSSPSSAFFDNGRSTSDLLGHLITDTVLCDASLDGLLSSTIVDLHQVLGETINLKDIKFEPQPELQPLEQEVPTPSPSPPTCDVVASKSRKRTAKGVLVVEVPAPSPAITMTDQSNSSEDQPASSISISVDTRYARMRRRNNEASKRSRCARKQKRQGMESEADELAVRNADLRGQVERLEKAVATVKSLLMNQMMSIGIKKE